MNRISIFTLKCMRHAYQKVFGLPPYQPIPLCDIEEGGRMIFNLLSRDKPCMIARYGAYEMLTVLNYLGIICNKHNIWGYIKNETYEWWWNRSLMERMQKNAGFFPPTEDSLSRFSEIMLEDSRQLDILAVMSFTKRNMFHVNKIVPNNTRFIPLVSVDSFASCNPWSIVLKDKNVLVIHPFSELIEYQYMKKVSLFDDNNILPNFRLRTVKAVQSIGGQDCGFNNWFDALDWMKSEMDKAPYDIALIGCGAYGFPLAAYAKKTGHKAVHIGGSLQLLFGIKGKRWENDQYGVDSGVEQGFYSRLMDNPAWVRPDEYRDKYSEIVEDACYW